MIAYILGDNYTWFVRRL